MSEVVEYRITEVVAVDSTQTVVVAGESPTVVVPSNTPAVVISGMMGPPGAAGTSQLSLLTDVDFSTPPSPGNVLAYDNTVSKWKPATDNRTWPTPRDLVITGDASATFSAVDGTSNVSASLSLATVNNNVGTYGSSVAVPVIVVNAKGLITAITTSLIPAATASSIGLASFNSTEFNVSNGAVSLNFVDGGTY